MELTRTTKFEHLFRDHYRAVRRFALRRTSGESAQDVVAETFLVAWRRLDELPEDPLPWLYGVARRVLANQRRSATRGAALIHRLAAEPPAAGPEDGDDAGDAGWLREALDRLSEREREALMLVAWDGLSGGRAARAAGCTRGAFAVRLHRARARMAAELEAQEPARIGHVNAEGLEAS